MKELDDFLKAKEEVYSYFNFKEDWAVYPIDDRRKMFWAITGDTVHYAPSAEALKQSLDYEDGGGELPEESYSDAILGHRFYPTPVYKGKEYTAILVDTQCDGNIFLAIFANSKLQEL